MKEFSLLTQDIKHCYICGKRALELHAIFVDQKNNSEFKSKEDGLVIPLCWACNIKLLLDPRKQRSLHTEAQIAFEQAWPNRNFVKRYGKDFLTLRRRAKE